MLCHKEVRRIAKELAGAAYEDFAKNDDFYAKFPNQNKFIARHWQNFVGIARQTLVYMLGQNYPEAMKEDIFDIYTKDRILQDVQSMPIQGSA